MCLKSLFLPDPTSTSCLPLIVQRLKLILSHASPLQVVDVERILVVPFVVFVLLLLFFVLGLDLIGEVEALHPHLPLEHPKSPLVVGLNLLDLEPADEGSSVVQGHAHVVHVLPPLILLHHGQELDDERVPGVDLHRFLAAQVRVLVAVGERLGPHDALHVRGVSPLPRDDHNGRRLHALADHDLVDLGAVLVLEVGGEGLELLVVGPASGRVQVLVLVAELQPLLGRRHEALAVELGDLLHGILVDGVDEVEDLESLGVELLAEGRGVDGLDIGAGDVVDVLLPLLHVLNVVLKGAVAVLLGLGGPVAQELDEL
mmetsp:Transcript_31197/g.61811  ORF Transcript_31197/g.61811 Transcript_31197/m.61811 type:complete len:315 (+) Transcript_31197:622-1566(+)